jgi:hypothetical protein
MRESLACGTTAWKGRMCHRSYRIYADRYFRLCRQRPRRPRVPRLPIDRKARRRFRDDLQSPDESVCVGCLPVSSECQQSPDRP